ncbi:DUF1439 domain-containing protein [Massilia sp. KIM]|uniref:DUF1439 domain-containing protein n=1 Tax=Massilia sp. KIM TaxID=1955422 RepID=UPI00099018E0|nr:DUF1439 domain-containing protein [Massilia sp. KIM]OON59176.1 DUF1439 domain-containing protein [Massilia sp. KIM]
MMRLRSLPTRSLARFAGVVAAASLLASCANLAGPRQVELPLHKLQAGLERRFPLDNRMLDVLNVRLTRPQLSIQPEQDRVALALDASVSPPFMSESWQGKLAFSGRLYVDPNRSAVMMAEPRVDRLDFGAGSGLAERQVANVANSMIGMLARDVPVYAFRMEDLRYAGVQFVPTRIATTQRGLLVTLEPVR